MDPVPSAVLRLMVFVDDTLWDEILVLPETVMSSSTSCPQAHDGDSNQGRLHPKYSVRIFVDGYFLSLFCKELAKSAFYRQNVIQNLSLKLNGNLKDNKVNQPPVARLDLSVPPRQVIDFNWNERLEIILAERSELDHAMSWFSTFGGAFSALGEEFQRCALVAGKIARTQLAIAWRLGDPLMVARCKLYWALSKIQQGRLGLARRIIVAQFRLAKNGPCVDARLVSMCQGIWAKLRYERQLRIDQRQAITTPTAHM